MAQLTFLFTLSCYLSICCAGISNHSSKYISKLPYKDFYNNSGTCFQKGVCQSAQNLSCFGTTLPYTSTSIDLVEDSASQLDVQDNLALWQGLRSVPRCWAVIQPLLCGVYMPKCENGSLYLPSQEMCRLTRGACKIVEVQRGWPSFLQCEDKKLFPARCRNPLQEIKFNTSYKCISPLVETDNPDNWFHEVEGCGIQCQDPLYTKKDHINTHYLTCFLSSLSFAFTSFTVVTFIINWKVSNRYPDKIVFYINLCWAIVSFGWIIQFFPGARKEIVCVHDGTIRRRQPESGQHLCSITFVLIYSFLMASIVWFVILTYAWYVRLREKGVPKDIEKKKAYFHMCAWCIPLVLTVITMAITEVDGDSMSGICFVGFSDINMRIIFVLFPVVVAALLGGCFLFLFLYNLVKIKLNSSEVTNEQASKKIRCTIFRTGFFSACFVTLIFITFSCHAYDFTHQQDWNKSLKDYIVCRAEHSAQSYSGVAESSESALSKCTLKSKPNVRILHIHMCCLLIFGVMVSSLVWTKATLESWKGFFYGLCAPAEKNANSLKKHQLIAKAFKKRHEINQGKDISFSSANENPLGLNMDISSAGSRDISSSWVMALPQFLMRRNAITGITPFVPRQYSSASDVSRHISVDSFNQQNLDSLSIQISEQDYQEQAWRQRRKTRKERERFARANRIAPWFPGNRRGSDTSLQSSLLAASMTAVASRNAIVGKVTKSTSTGDLGIQSPVTNHPSLMPSIIMPQPRHRNLIQHVALNPPPFTHGMTDNSHRPDYRNMPSAIGSSIGQRYTPIPMASNIQTPYPGMLRPSLYGQGYDMINAMPTGFIGGGMYPTMNGVYPRFSIASNFAFPTYNLPYIACGAYQNMDTMTSQVQPSIIPLHPRADSSSEAEFFPIILSESEFTDTGMRSHDESYVLTTHRLMQERLQAQLLTKAQEEAASKEKSLSESRASVKTSLSKKLTSNTTTPRPNSGRKSHDSAPPPSPANSFININSMIQVNTNSVEEGSMNPVMDDNINSVEINTVPEKRPEHLENESS